jgi:CBS domain-containing protein
MSGSFLTPRLEHARVSDAMRHGVFSCSADASVRDAARTMSMHHVHCVVVSDPDDGSALGVLPDGTLLGALLEAPDGEVLLRDVVDRDPTAVGSDEPLAVAAELMRARGLTHVLVRDHSTGRPSGMLSTLDVAGILAWGEA